jgi:hypothetical protein
MRVFILFSLILTMIFSLSVIILPGAPTYDHFGMLCPHNQSPQLCRVARSSHLVPWYNRPTVIGEKAQA